MNLTELLQKLSYGPLAELAIVGEGSGIVPPENIPRLIIPINDALLKLYTRFALQRRTVVLETVDGIYAYQLAPQFAQLSGSAEINKYIKDTPATPFLNDVLQVLDVLGNQAALPSDPYYTGQSRLDENDYVSLPIDDRNNRLSWHMLSYNTLGMDYPATGARYFIQYRAKHASIPLQPANPTQVEILLPDTLETALLANVAGAIYSTMSMDTALAKSKMHMSLYEAECQRVENEGLYNKFAEETNMKAYRNGWV